jgi:hypothetical protein
MALVSELVDEINDSAHSYVRDQEQATSLAGAALAGDLILSVSDATQLSRGLIEVGDELMWVAQVDTQSSQVSIEPWGRAQGGSTATAHAVNSKVVNSPSFPRQRILNVLSDVVQEIFPDVCAVGETFLTHTSGIALYALPSDVHAVLSVEYRAVGASGSYIPVERWRQNKRPTSVELEVFGRIPPGDDRIRVTYVKTISVPLAMTDDLETLGYGNGIRGLLVLGAVAKLMVFIEPSRVQSSAVESSARAADVPAGSATSLSRYLYQLFRQRLDDEARQLRIRFPAVPHWTR